MLELVIRCTICGDEIDTWELGEEDPRTQICEIAGDLNLNCGCADDLSEYKPHPDPARAIAQYSEVPASNRPRHPVVQSTPLRCPACNTFHYWRAV